MKGETGLGKPKRAIFSMVLGILMRRFRLD
jgi:hypothetical protein